MKNFTEIKNLALDKIALLGLLVLALFLAKLVVDTRSGVHLSNPQILNPMGISVKMPVGNGWRSAQRWHFTPGQYVIDGIYIHPMHNQKTAALRCQYILAAEKLTPKEIFLQKASRIGAEILETNKIRTASLFFEWALMKDSQGLNRFFAVTMLPDSRQLNIELSEWANDADYAKRVFKTILKNAYFEDNKFLNSGTVLVKKIKQRGMTSFLPKPQKDFYLVRDNKNKNLGFEMDLLTVTGPHDKLAVKAVDFLYLSNPYEVYSAFQGDNSFNQFSWQQQTSTGRENIQTELQNDKLTVTRSFPESQQNVFQLNPAAIPDVFLKQLFIQLLESPYERIIVDNIDSSGSVIPMQIKKINIPENYSYALSIQLLDDGRQFQNIYFDGKKDFVKIQQPEKNIILEKNSMENIMKLFPDKAQHIQNISDEFNVLQLKR